MFEKRYSVQDILDYQVLDNKYPFTEHVTECEKTSTGIYTIQPAGIVWAITIYLHKSSHFYWEIQYGLDQTFITGEILDRGTEKARIELVEKNTKYNLEKAVLNTATLANCRVVVIPKETPIYNVMVDRIIPVRI